MNARRSTAAALITLVCACGTWSCSAPAGGARSTAPPVVFGGQGANVGAPKEQPLAPEPSPGAASSSAGPCAAPSPPSDVALLDDFEDGDHAAFHGFEREGWWFSVADSTEGATLSPEHGSFRPERLVAAEARKDNLFAAHFKAAGQKDWGAVWGVSLRHASNGIRCPLNVSAFAGLRFRAKGPGTVRVAFGIPETQPADSGGTCTTGCYDVHGKVVYLSDRWDDYLVAWNRLEQGGWGTQARFDPARVVSLQFMVKPQDLPVDFWLDDLAFVDQHEADALAAAQHAQPAPPPPAPATTADAAHKPLAAGAAAAAKKPPAAAPPPGASAPALPLATKPAASPAPATRPE